MIRCPKCDSKKLRYALDGYGYLCKDCSCEFKYDGYNLIIIVEGNHEA